MSFRALKTAFFVPFLYCWRFSQACYPEGSDNNFQIKVFSVFFSQLRSVLVSSALKIFYFFENVLFLTYGNILPVTECTHYLQRAEDHRKKNKFVTEGYITLACTVLFHNMKKYGESFKVPLVQSLRSPKTFWASMQFEHCFGSSSLKRCCSKQPLTLRAMARRFHRNIFSVWFFNSFIFFLLLRTCVVPLLTFYHFGKNSSSRWHYPIAQSGREKL